MHYICYQCHYINKISLITNLNCQLHKKYTTNCTKTTLNCRVLTVIYHHIPLTNIYQLALYHHIWTNNSLPDSKLDKKHITTHSYSLCSLSSTPCWLTSPALASFWLWTTSPALCLLLVAINFSFQCFLLFSFPYLSLLLKCLHLWEHLYKFLYYGPSTYIYGIFFVSL